MDSSPMQYPRPGAIQPPANKGQGPAKLWVLQGFSSPTTPGGGLGVSSDFANLHSSSIPKTPKTPKTPKGVAVPSRDGNLTELGYANWSSIWDGILRKVLDEAHYGNAMGGDGSEGGHSASGPSPAVLTAQSVHDLLQSVVGAHLPAWKAYLNSSLRSNLSVLPASPGAATISGPIPPLSQQLLLPALASFLSGVLLPHQSAQIVEQFRGQCYYIIGQILRGVGFPVDTLMQSAAAAEAVAHSGGGAGSNGGACGLRFAPSLFQARMDVFRMYMRAASLRHQRVLSQQHPRSGSSPAPQPLFYLSPAFAHSLGFPDSLPRVCWELGLSQASFKVMPLGPRMDEAILKDMQREEEEREGTATADGMQDQQQQQQQQQPNPFLTYALDLHALESELHSDMIALTQGSSNLCPAAVFATVGNGVGLDCPYEFDDLQGIARMVGRMGMMVHAEGKGLFNEGVTDEQATESVAPAANGSMNGASSHTSPPHSLSPDRPSCSSLFLSVDSILFSSGEWLGLSSAPVCVAWRDPRFLPLQSEVRHNAEANGLWSSLGQHASFLSISGGGVPSAGEFADLLGVWFNLVQIHHASFPTVLARLTAKQCEKIVLVRRMLGAQKYPTLVAPRGEGEEEVVEYLARITQQQGDIPPSLPPIPSHTHLFFSVALPSPWVPAHFHMTPNGLNRWVSSRLSQRLASKQGDYLSMGRVFGLSLVPVQHFDTVGLMFHPAPVGIWSTDSSFEEEISLLSRFLTEVVAGEIGVVEMQGKLRGEFEELLLAEAPEFLYLSPDQIAPQPGLFVGLGGIRFVPAQVAEHHLDEVGILFNEALARIAQSFHVPPHSQGNKHRPPESPPAAAGLGSFPNIQGMESMYKPGRIVSTKMESGGLSVSTSSSGHVSQGGQVCTVLELSDLLSRKSLRDLLGELKSAASKLVYPNHILEDISATLREGIRAAEEKLISKSVDAYRPTSVLRWVPLLGGVINWVAPAPTGENTAGQSFDMKKKELSSMKYSYSGGNSVASTPSGAGSAGVSRKGSIAGLTPGASPSSTTNTPASSSTSPLSINPQYASPVVTTNGTPSQVSTGNSAAVAPASLNSPPPHSQGTPAHARKLTPQAAQGGTPVYAAAAVPGLATTVAASTTPVAPLSASSKPPLPPVAGMHHTPPFTQVPVHVSQPTFPKPPQHPPTPQQTSPPQRAPVPPLQNQYSPSQQPTPTQQSLSQPSPAQPSPAAVVTPSNAPPPPTSSPTAPQQLPQQSPPRPQPLPPVKVTLDEADRGFVELLNKAPRHLSAQQLEQLKRGEQFSAYFPMDPDPSATAGGSDVSSTSVTNLLLFFEPAYNPTRDEALELGVAPDVPVSLLCWCEPHVERYVKTDQAVSLDQVSALHLGGSTGNTGMNFPPQALRQNCFSIVTQHVALHLEAPDTQKRKEWFLALYTLVSQAPALTPNPQAVTGDALSPPMHTPTSSALSPASTESSVARARALLEGGFPFVVYVLDKHDVDLTTRHEVVLWYRPPQPSPTASGAGVPHSLCWCRRGNTLDFSPARSLPLHTTVQICMGKQTKAFKNAAASQSDPAAAFSVMVDKMILNLEASSPDDRTAWLSAFHTVMSAAGKKRVFDAEQAQAEATPQGNTPQA